MKTPWSLLLAGLAQVCAGCALCQSPYDYSAPVAGSPSIPYGATVAREGSVYAGGAPAMAAPTPAPVPNAPPASAPVQATYTGPAQPPIGAQR